MFVSGLFFFESMYKWLGCLCLCVRCVNLFILVYYNLNHIYVVLLQQNVSLRARTHIYNIVLDIFMFICM